MKIDINKQIKAQKFVGWQGSAGGYIVFESGEIEIIEGEVLHESEFLQYVVDQLVSCSLCANQTNNLDAEFLSLVTGVDEGVFKLLIENDDDYGMKSIIKATIGMYELSKKALDYYGICYFVSHSKTLDNMHDLGDGYYYFRQER